MTDYTKLTREDFETQYDDSLEKIERIKFSIGQRESELEFLPNITTEIFLNELLCNRCGKDKQNKINDFCKNCAYLFGYNPTALDVKTLPKKRPCENCNKRNENNTNDFCETCGIVFTSNDIILDKLYEESKILEQKKEKIAKEINSYFPTFFVERAKISQELEKARRKKVGIANRKSQKRQEQIDQTKEKVKNFFRKFKIEKPRPKPVYDASQYWYDVGYRRANYKEETEYTKGHDLFPKDDDPQQNP